MELPGPERAHGLAALFVAQREELRRFLIARCGSIADAEDHLQDLWIRLESLAVGPIANGRAYLFRMANNLVLDSLRGRTRAMRRDLNWLEADGNIEATPENRIDPAPTAEQVMASADEARILREAIDALPPGARRALMLNRFEGLTQSEVAKVMGISRSGVEKHLALAMVHLRRTFADCGLLDTAASKISEERRAGDLRLERGK